MGRYTDNISSENQLQKKKKVMILLDHMNTYLLKLTSLFTEDVHISLYITLLSLLCVHMCMHVHVCSAYSYVCLCV